MTLNEANTRKQLIDRALESVGWKDEYLNCEYTFTVDKKYIDKEIYIAFIENNVVKMYDHDEAVNMLPDNIKQSDSWNKHGSYSWGKTPKIYDSVINEI